MKIQVLLFLFISQTIRGENLPIKNDYLIQSQEINELSDSSKSELSSLIYKYKTSKNTLNQYEILDQIISNKNILKGHPELILGYTKLFKERLLKHLNQNTNSDSTAKKLKFYLGNTYLDEAKSYRDIGETQNAISSYLEALKIFEEINNIKGMASVYNGMAIVHEHMDNFKEAIAYLQKSIALKQQVFDLKGIANSLNNLGNNHYRMALNENKDIVKLKELENALTYYKKSLKTQEMIHNKLGISESYNNIASIYLIKKEYDKAIQFFKKAIELKEEIGEEKALANSYFNLASCFYGLKNYKDAHLYLNKSNVLAHKYNQISFIQQNKLLESNLYYSAGKYADAYQALKTYIELSKKFNDSDLQKIIAKKQATYEYEKSIAIKETEYKKNIEIVEEKKKRQTLISWGVGVVLLFSFMGGG